jgi:Rps23 Pro-64 3,4-dihydroxylase Tpa1-like proline 4-hydroxylase
VTQPEPLPHARIMGARDALRSFEADKLHQLARRSAEFQNAIPFPQIIFDDFLKPEVAEEILGEFSIPDDKAVYYHHYNNHTVGLYDTAEMGPSTRALLEDLQKPEFLAFLEKLTGIQGLLYDPQLDGAGLHDTRRGGHLNMHVDFLAHTMHKHWSRQLNLLIFLNKDWREEYNGYLEFWDMKARKRHQKIEPAFNRCVLFRTTRVSFHGYPRPLECPPHMSRKSIACYYYRDENRLCSLEPTYYQPLPTDSAWEKSMIALDRFALRVYSGLKRYRIVSDSLFSRIGKFF